MDVKELEGSLKAESKGDLEGGLEEPEQEYPQGLRLLLIMLALFITEFAVGLDQTIVASAIPKISNDFNALNQVGWYGSAYINLPPGGITVLIVLFFCNPPPIAQTLPILSRLKRMDWIGAVLLLSSSTCLLLALQDGGIVLAWNSSTIIGLLVGFASMLVAFFVLQVYLKEEASINIRVLLQRNVFAIGILNFCVGATYYSLLYFVPIFFQAIQGSSPIRSGVQTLAMIVPVVVGNVATGWLVSKFLTYHWEMLFGGVTVAVGAGLLATMNASTGVGKWAGYQVVAGAGMGAIYMMGYIATQATLPLADRGKGASIVVFLQLFGATVWVSASEAIYQNQLLAGISKIPGLDVSSVVDSGVSKFREVVPASLFDVFVAIAAMASVGPVRTAVLGVTKMVLPVRTTALFALAAALLASAQDGSVTSATSSAQSANYSCDATACVLPSCNCASVKPPGGLEPANVPQFVTFTADDAIESYTTEAVNFFLAHRTNPNGCAPKMTYFTSTNYSMVTDWYVAGNEIADHTMTHVGTPNSSEILGNLKALNAFSGIPYDSSATSATPANESDTDAYWPYTLDYGAANDCLDVDGICSGQIKLPGLWEIPMYAIFDEQGAAGIHLMDVWLDSTNVNDSLAWMKSTFLTHYNGNRQPFGLYTHPIHLAVGYPGVTDPNTTRSMINTFLDWVQEFDDVWLVSNEQLLEWVKAPVTNAEIGNVTALQCSTPVVNAKICNGIEANEVGLLLNCPFIDFPWTTCYGCPVSSPTPQDPVPAQNTTIGVRYHISDNCSTAFFDPITNTCLCTNSSCAFQDNTGPITNSTRPSNGTVSSATATSKKGAAATNWNRATLALATTLLGGAVLLVVA
ncbi:hypothetical protein RQP46_000960 [Phenoliferia psychrophenolica]